MVIKVSSNPGHLMILWALLYDVTELLVVKVIGYLCSSLLSSLYFVSALLETINDYAFYLSFSELTCGGEMIPHLTLLCQTVALWNFEYPWDVETSMALLPGTMIVCQVLFRVRQLFAAAQTLWRGTVATQTLVAGAAGAQPLAVSDAVEPEHQPRPV